MSPRRFTVSGFVFIYGDSMRLCEGYRPRLCWILFLVLFTTHPSLSSGEDLSSTTEVLKVNTDESDGEFA